MRRSILALIIAFVLCIGTSVANATDGASTNTTELKEVTAVFVRESDHINYLTFADEFGNEQVIESTDGHPFWLVTDR